MKAKGMIICYAETCKVIREYLSGNIDIPEVKEEKTELQKLEEEQKVLEGQMSDIGKLESQVKQEEDKSKEK